MMQPRIAESANSGQKLTPVLSVTSDLLIMNRDALAALVTLGARSGDPLMFINNATDRFTVTQMLKQVAA